MKAIIALFLLLPSARSLSITELAEKYCATRTKTERETLLCLNAYMAGSLEGVKVGRNIPSTEATVICSPQGECVIHLPATEPEPSK